MSEDRIVGMSVVTRRFQVTIPKEVRELLSLKVGDMIVFVKRGEDIVLKKGKVVVE